jgi:hypothetical protein
MSEPGAATFGVLQSRGTIIPGLAQLGLSDRAVRTASQASGQGGWKSGQLLVNWETALAVAGSAKTAAELSEQTLRPPGRESAVGGRARQHRARHFAH